MKMWRPKNEMPPRRYHVDDIRIWATQHEAPAPGIFGEEVAVEQRVVSARERRNCHEKGKEARNAEIQHTGRGKVQRH